MTTPFTPPGEKHQGTFEEDTSKRFVPSLNQYSVEAHFVRCVSEVLRNEPVVSTYYDNIGSPDAVQIGISFGFGAFTAWAADKLIFRKRYLKPKRLFWACSITSVLTAVVKNVVFKDNPLRYFSEEAAWALRYPVRTVLGDVALHCYTAVDGHKVWAGMLPYAEKYRNTLLPPEWRNVNPLKPNPLEGPLINDWTVNYWLDCAEEAEEVDFIQRSLERPAYQHELAGNDKSRLYHMGVTDEQIKREYERDVAARLNHPAIAALVAKREALKKRIDNLGGTPEERERARIIDEARFDPARNMQRELEKNAEERRLAREEEAAIEEVPEFFKKLLRRFNK